MNQKYNYQKILSIIILLINIVNICQTKDAISRQVEVFVNVYNHPKTGFSCHDKNPGEYYADPAAKCAVYYVCIPNPTGTMSPQSFACPNGTIFSQATRVCRPHEEVFCPLAARYYDSVDGSIDNHSEHIELPTAPTVADAPRQPAQPQPSQSASRQHHRSPQQPNTSTNHNNQNHNVNNNNNNHQNNHNSMHKTPKSQPKIQSSQINPASKPANSFNNNNINRNFRNSRFGIANAQVSTTTTTTTTTTTAAPPPQPSDLGVGDYEYDYSDYNETGLVSAAATLLESTILNPNNHQQQHRFVDLHDQNESMEESDSNDENENFHKQNNERRKRNAMIDNEDQKRENYDLNDTKLMNTLLLKNSIANINQLKQISIERFDCSNKLIGYAYADIENDCQKFFLCLTFKKGKTFAYEFECEMGKYFDQQKGQCIRINDNDDDVNNHNFDHNDKETSQQIYLRKKCLNSSKFKSNNVKKY